MVADPELQDAFKAFGEMIKEAVLAVDIVFQQIPGARVWESYPIADGNSILSIKVADE